MYQARRRPKRPRSRCTCCLVFALVTVGLTVGLWVAVSAFGRSMVDSEIAKLRAAGKPVTGLDLAPPPVPDDENAAPLYLQAADIVEPKGQSSEARLYYDTDRDDPDEMELLAHVVNANSEAIELLRDAASRPHVRFDVDWSDPVRIDRPHLPRLRANARFLSAAAAVSAYEGDRVETLRRLQIGLAPARHLREGDPGLLPMLNGMATDAIALRAAEEVIAQGPLPEAEARELADELLCADYHEWFRETIEADRVFGLAYFDLMTIEPDDFRHDVPSRVDLETYIPMWRYADQRVYLQALAAAEADASVPLRVRRQTTDAAPPVPWWAGVTRMGAGPGHRTAMKVELAGSRRRLCATALGVEVYRQKLGHYPESLADLEAIDWPPCEDSLSGEDFIYGRNGDTYTLYGVGLNLKDDGGKAPSRRAGIGEAGPHDIVWGAEYQK